MFVVKFCPRFFSICTSTNFDINTGSLRGSSSDKSSSPTTIQYIQSPEVQRKTFRGPAKHREIDRKQLFNLTNAYAQIRRRICPLSASPENQMVCNTTRTRFGRGRGKGRPPTNGGLPQNRSFFIFLRYMHDSCFYSDNNMITTTIILNNACTFLFLNLLQSLPHSNHLRPSQALHKLHPALNTTAFEGRARQCYTN